MALLDFPSGPSVGQSTTQNGNTWKWNGTSWVAYNTLSLSSQVTGILAVDYGGTGFGGTYSVGDILYAASANTFAKLAAGTAGSVLASGGNNAAPYWKIDDSGTGSVGNGTPGGLAYYNGLNTITSGTAFSYINGPGAGGTGAYVVLTQSSMALVGSTITSGTWAGSAIGTLYGGTNNTVSGVGHSYRVAMYDASGTAITNISSVGTANSVLLQTSQTSAPSWVGQNTLIVGGATTAARWQNARTITFSGGGVTGSFSIDGSGDVSGIALTVTNDSIALGTKTTGNYAQSVAGAGNGLSTIGSAGEGTDFTIHSNATSSNTNSTLVFRDGTGNFSATTITANLTGTASIASSAANVNIVSDTSNTLYLLGTKSTGSIASTQVYSDSSVSINGNTITAANFSGLASSASNLLGGTAGAGSSIHIQTGLNTTGFLNHPAAAGYALTTTAAGLAYGQLTNLAVTTLGAGSGIYVNQSQGAVNVANIGVTSLTSGNTNRITVGGSGVTGAVTVNLPDTVQLTDIQVTGNSSTLTNVGGLPTSMVNKQYVDNLASGLDIHGSVRVVITSAIGGSYYQPNYGIGSSAIGAYITSIGNSDLTSVTFDGKTLAVNQRVLVAGGLTATGKTSINGSALVTPANSYVANGIYYVGSVGSGASQWYMYRATDTDENIELTAGTFAFVEEGTTYADSGWVCVNDTTNLGPIQLGGTAITFSQFTGAASISFGQGLTQIGNAVATNVNLSSTGVANGTGFTQFNIGGAAGAGAAATGYYPTFSVKTNTTHSGTALLTLNHTGFSLVGSTNTAATLTVTGNISLPNPGTAYGLAYASDSSTVAFSSAGSAGQILKSNASSAPTWIDQSTLIVGGATTAARWQDARTVTFATGDVTGSFSINGSADVSNVALTIAANSVALGTDTTGNYAASVTTSGSGISTIGSAGEGTAFTIDSNATSNNTNSTLVFRDGSGSFSATTITANLTGTASIASSAANVNVVSDTSNTLYLLGTKSTGSIASTQVYSDSSVSINGNTITATTFSGNATTSTNSGAAGKWITSRTITFSGGGITGSFSIDGSGDVSGIALTVTNDSIALGTKTTGNYAASVTTSGSGISTIGSAGEGTAFTIDSNATSNNTNSTLVLRDGTGSFSATTITANLTGTASIASSAANVNVVSDTSNTLYLLGTKSTGSIASTQVYSDSSVSINGSSITAGVWGGTAISVAKGGTNNTISGNGHSSKVAVYDYAGTSITSYSLTPGSVIYGATGSTFTGLASTLLPVVAISSAPPAQPSGAIGATQPGQLWWDNTYGVLKIYYTDASDPVTSQWVDATPVLGSSGTGSSTKRSYVLSFGAGFTPSTGADTVQIQIPYAPDNTSKFYYIKRLDYRNETTSGGSGVTFFIERHTTGSVGFSPTFRIHTAGSGVGASFIVGPTVYNTSYTLAGTGASFVSSSGVAGSVISGDYLRLNFTALGTAATLSVSMVIEEQ